MGDFDANGVTDLLWQNTANPSQYWIYLMAGNSMIGGGSLSVAAGYRPTFVADFNGDTHPDYLLFNAATRGTVIWYLSGVTRTGSRNGPTIPAGFEVAGLADFDGNADPTICFTIRARATQQFGT
jgi:hypothetical protein